MSDKKTKPRGRPKTMDDGQATGIYLDGAILAAIDERRGEKPRSEYMRELLRLGLGLTASN